MIPWLLLALSADGEPALVRVVASSGAVDGPAEIGSGAARWERVRIELEIENRIGTEIGDLELEIGLYAAGDDSAIPGWSFRERVQDRAFPARESSFLRIVRDLPARRSSPPADEISYRVLLISYRLLPPDLDTALELASSPHAADQRAALHSFEASEGDDRAVLDAIGEELGTALLGLRSVPRPSDALRLLLAVRAIGTLGAAAQIEELLYLPERLEPDAWGATIIELAERMRSASDSEAPRLQILPSWARDPGSTYTLRAREAVENAVEEAVLGMGDRAVPALIRLRSAPEISVQARAERILAILGRSTWRSRLAMKDRATRWAVIESLGQLRDPEALPALLALPRGRDAEQDRLVAQTLALYGAVALPALIEHLERGEPWTSLVIQRIAEAHPAAWRGQAERFAIRSEPKEPLAAWIQRLRQLRVAEANAAHQAALGHALELGREGAFDEALALLDSLYERSPQIYWSRASEIAALYRARAKGLIARGDWDAAVNAAKTGLGVAADAELRALLIEAQLALVRGYLELGGLDRATELLAELDQDHAEVRLLGARLLAKRAQAALNSAREPEANKLVQRGLALDPDNLELRNLERRLLLLQNLPLLGVVALAVPVLLLLLAVTVWRRRQQLRLEQLAEAIDGG